MKRIILVGVAISVYAVAQCRSVLASAR